MESLKSPIIPEPLQILDCSESHFSFQKTADIFYIPSKKRKKYPKTRKLSGTLEQEGKKSDRGRGCKMQEKKGRITLSS